MFNRTSIIALTVIVLSVFGSSLYGITEVGGDIAQETIWGPDSPTIPDTEYHVVSDVYVNNGAILTIEPGVTVRFNNSKGLYIGEYGSVNAGSLYAVGEALQKITFTSFTGDAGQWDGVRFYGNDHFLQMTWPI